MPIKSEQNGQGTSEVPSSYDMICCKIGARPIKRDTVRFASSGSHLSTVGDYLSASRMLLACTTIGGDALVQ